MGNNRLLPDTLPSDIELLGDGQSFQDTVCAMLMEVKGFESFEQSDLLFLAKHMKAYRVRKGITIFREGDQNCYLCMLIKGRIGVHKEDQDSEIKLLGTITPGKIFGEISIIDNLPHSATLIAESDAIFLLMSKESFRQCTEHEPILGGALVGPHCSPALRAVVVRQRSVGRIHSCLKKLFQGGIRARIFGIRVLS